MKIEQKREFIGRYYSLLHPQIASKISGFIQKVYVEEGDRVKKAIFWSLSMIKSQELPLVPKNPL